MATVDLTADETRGATGLQDNRPWYVWAVSYQGGADGVITPVRSNPIRPVAGVLKIPVEAGIAAIIENPDGKRYQITAPEFDTNLWEVIAAAVAVPPDATADMLAEAIAQSGYALKQLAANPEQILVDAITRSETGAATSFAVAWPDGATGVFTGTESVDFPGGIDSYTVTHVKGSTTRTYTQPTLTRDDSGAVTNRPAIEVS